MTCIPFLYLDTVRHSGQVIGLTEKSPNAKKQIKHLRRGLSIYKTGRSPFWHTRVHDSATKRYVVRSTKESNRLDAAEVAEEIVADLQSKQNTAHAVTKDRSFEYYARLLSDMTRVQKKGSRNKYAFSDEYKILYREWDGAVSYFGKNDVGKLNSGMVRDYLTFLDSRRDKPLATSTKAKQCRMIRRVLMHALEDGVIDIIPTMLKQRTRDAPWVSFSDREYRHLLEISRKCANQGDKVRGVDVTREHYKLIVFVVHTFLRPTETELFGIRYCDIEVKDDPKHLLMTLTGKTGYRTSASLEAAVDILAKQPEINPNAADTEFVFMPEYQNRTTAVNTYGTILNFVLWRGNSILRRSTYEHRQRPIGPVDGRPVTWRSAWQRRYSFRTHQGTGRTCAEHRNGRAPERRAVGRAV